MSPLSSFDKLRTTPRWWASAALVTAGLAGGAILGYTVSAGASTTSTTTPAAGSGSAAWTGHAGPFGGAGFRGLTKSGTVTAVGAGSVTIDGTSYVVTANSDIDKNGEATLSDLKVGDKVTFAVTSASTPTIAVLHAGSEALDRPAGGPGWGGGPGGGPMGGGPIGGGYGGPSGTAIG